MVPHMTSFLPSLVWPEPNPFLLAISMYEKDNVTKEWEKECRQLHATIFVPSNNDGSHLVTFYRQFTQISICAIDVSVYILCVVYYMNLIGMVWELVNYMVFWTFKWITRYETWKDSHNIDHGRKRSFVRNLIGYLFTNKTLIHYKLSYTPAYGLLS